jgi:hypothetical protein
MRSLLRRDLFIYAMELLLNAIDLVPNSFALLVI